MLEPTISIVTSVKNGSGTLERCLESTWKLRAGLYEHIVQDGGSGDGTQAILKKWIDKTDGFVKAQFQPDNGIADGFNKGIARASGEWIAILNADDWYTESTLNHIAPFLDRQFSILHGMIRQHRADGTSRVVGKSSYDPAHHFRPLKTMPAQHPTCFVHREVYERVGLFDTSYTIAMDYDFLLRAHLLGAAFIYIPEVITNFSVGGASAKNPLIGMREMWQSKKQHTGQVIQPAFWYFRQWLKWRKETPPR